MIRFNTVFKCDNKIPYFTITIIDAANLFLSRDKLILSVRFRCWKITMYNKKRWYNYIIWTRCTRNIVPFLFYTIIICLNRTRNDRKMLTEPKIVVVRLTLGTRFKRRIFPFRSKPDILFILDMDKRCLANVCFYVNACDIFLPFPVK